MMVPWRPSLFAGVALLIAGCGGPRAQPAPWLINETPSLPRGLYRLTDAPPTRGAIVALSPPRQARPYLAGLGAPPDARLLKRVAAGPGEMVCRRGERLTWPGGRVTALPRDRRGRPLPQWRGCRALRPDERLVMGDTLSSFDSRYFGPVRSTAITGAYREVWRW